MSHKAILRRKFSTYYQSQSQYSSLASTISASTKAIWRKSWLCRLTPKHLDKGHHQKLEPALLDFMAEFIKKHYFTAKNRRVSGVYREFQLACSQQEPVFKPPQKKHFVNRLKDKKITNSL